MKKIISFLLVLVLALSFVGCNDKTPPEGAVKEETEKGVVDPEFFTWKGTKITGYSETGLKQKNIIIPEECTEFSYAALKENTTVETISFEGDDVALNGHLFSECSALKSVVLPKSITEIPKSLFNGCTSLQKIEIPDSVTKIGELAFFGCEALESVKLSSRLEVIEDNAFTSCKVLKSIDFPSTLKSIGRKAFEFNNSLQNFVLPEGLESIGYRAFFNCHSLTSVTIPSSITELEDMVFTYCDALEEIYIPASVEKMSTTSVSQTHTTTVYVKEGSFADKAFESYNDGFLVKEYY